MATLGRRIGVGKAALTGGLLGSVPDADVFWPFDDPVDRFVLHRSATHSLVIQALVTPVFAEALIRFFRPLREARWLGYLAVYLCFATHALLDTMTIYGTRLFWPVWQEPLAVGSVFIIDPLYTLPFLIVIVWGFFLKNWTPRFGKALVGAFVLSTAYLAWGVVAQQIAEARAGRILADAGVSPERIFATPTPFNSLFWRVVAIDGERYVNLYVPLLGGAGAITAYAHPRYPDTFDCPAVNGAMKRLVSFSRGFYRFAIVDGALVMSDLRMGLTPGYSFSFVVAERDGATFREAAPKRVLAERGAPGDLRWLADGILGRKSIRPAEARQRADLRPGAGAERKAEDMPAGC